MSLLFNIKIREMHMYSIVKITIVSVSVLMTISACGNSGSADSPVSSTELQSSTDMSLSTVQDLVGELPPGDVSSYGAITVGDDAGLASDLVAAFFKLGSSVSADSLTSAFNGGQTLCSVDDDDIVDFEEISVGFIPSFNGLTKQAISAGENIVLGNNDGTFATIQSQTAGSFLFYTLPDSQVLPSQVVPANLQVDITGDAFPGYQSARFPRVEKLGDVNFGDSATISATSTLTWTPSTEPGSLIRIFASTAGGFFVEDGMTVTCLAPDTGSFEFPMATQAELGNDFVGGVPIVSRVAISTETKGSSVLFLIRESFAS